MQIIPTFFMERPVMYRERASRLYAVLPWVQAMEDVELPWILLQVRCSCFYSVQMLLASAPCISGPTGPPCALTHELRSMRCQIPVFAGRPALTRAAVRLR